MRFILREFESIQKMPTEVAVIRTTRPSQFEKTTLTAINVKITETVNFQ